MACGTSMDSLENYNVPFSKGYPWNGSTTSERVVLLFVLNNDVKRIFFFVLYCDDALVCTVLGIMEFFLPSVLMRLIVSPKPFVLGGWERGGTGGEKTSML